MEKVVNYFVSKRDEGKQALYGCGEVQMSKNKNEKDMKQREITVI